MFALFALVVAALAVAGGVAVAHLSPATTRSLDELEESFRTRFAAFLADAERSGKPLLVTETHRTLERQAWLFGSSRPDYTFGGVHYGRKGPWLTDRSPEHPSEHQKRKAADTIPHPSTGIKADAPGAVDFMMSLLPLAKAHGLTNLPGVHDYGHWENL